MSGPWEAYRGKPWEAYAGAKTRKRGLAEDIGVGGLRGLGIAAADMFDAAMSGPAGGVFGAIRSAANMANVFQGGGFDTSMAAPTATTGAIVRRNTTAPQTSAGRYAQAITQNIPAAIAPGTRAQRAVNVFAPAVVGEAGAQAAQGMGFGETGQEVARLVGSTFGAGLSSVRPNNFAPRAPLERLARSTKQDPAAMLTRKAEYDAVGIKPALIDVMDASGRGFVRGAANRMTPGREAASEFAEGRVVNLPSRMSGQARAAMSRDPRTPDAIRAAETARRTARAGQAFGAVRGDVLEMAPETVQALRTDYGRAAIAEAARRERDPEVKAALLRLSEDVLDNPSTPITIGMADRISRVLLSQGRAAGDIDLASTLNNLGRSVREPARQASPGYGAALEGFEQDSRLIEAAGVGEDFLSRNTDEFVAQAANLDPRARALAAAAGRRAIERKSGENISTAATTARQIATAPEQRQRTAALIGPDRARRLEQGMRLEARAVSNAMDVNPRGGSSTFLNLENEDKLREAGGVAMDVIQGNKIGLIGRVFEAMKKRGMTDEQIEELVRVSIDVDTTEDNIQAIARALGPEGARPWLELRNAALASAPAALGASAAMSPALAAP
jgi:hypothetical protein